MVLLNIKLIEATAENEIVFCCNDYLSEQTKGLISLYNDVSSGSIKYLTQEGITASFDNVFDALIRIDPNLSIMYRCQYREIYVNDLQDFPNAKITQGINTPEGVIQVEKTIKEWVLNMLQNAIVTVDAKFSKRTRPETPEEKNLRETYEFNAQLIEENLEIMQEQVRETTYPHDISRTGEYVVFQRDMDSGKIWLFDKYGTYLKFFQIEEFCLHPVFSNDDRYMMFRLFHKPDVAQVVDIRKRQLLSREDSAGLIRDHVFDLSPEKSKTRELSQEEIDENHKIIQQNLEKIKLEINEDCYIPKGPSDKKWLVFRSKNNIGRVWIYDKNGECLSFFVTPEDCWAPTISPDNEWLVFKSKEDNGKFWVYDMNNKRLLSLEESALF